MTNKMVFRNYYECPHCKSEWSDDWSCQVDDDCPECGKPELARQISAVGFALKGTGWYVTDFRGGSGGAVKRRSGQPRQPADHLAPGAVQPALPGTGVVRALRAIERWAEHGRVRHLST